LGKKGQNVHILLSNPLSPSITIASLSFSRKGGCCYYRKETVTDENGRADNHGVKDFQAEKYL